MTDSLSTSKIINDIKPDEIYNLAAQSHVKVSFDVPEYTANVDAIGTLRILESIRLSKLVKKLNFIKQVHQNYLEKTHQFHKMKIQFFIQLALME